MKQLPLGDVKTVTNLGIEIHVGLPVGRATRFRGERGRGERAGSRGASGGCEPPGSSTGGFTPPARRGCPIVSLAMLPSPASLSFLVARVGLRRTNCSGIGEAECV